MMLASALQVPLDIQQSGGGSSIMLCKQLSCLRLRVSQCTPQHHHKLESSSALQKVKEKEAKNDKGNATQGGSATSADVELNLAARLWPVHTHSSGVAC